MKKRKKYYRKNKEKTRTITLSILSLIIILILCSSFLFKSTFFSDIGNLLTGIFISKNIDYKNITSLQEENLKKEIDDLTKLLSLKETMTNYEIITTTVVNRNIDYWFYNLTVDKGKKDGIEIDMIVVNQDGLVGRVVEVNNNSSVIKLISSNDSLNKIAVDIISGENIYKGVISGYDLEEDKLLITSIRSSSEIKIKDKVITNGIGNLFPAGIIIGEVSDITTDDLGVSKLLKVKPSVDFENLRYLAILKRGNDS